MLHIMDRAVYKPKQALIVEDDAHNLLALGSLLKGLNIHFKRNTTGADVLQQARRVRPDFILLDMDLPYGDPFSIYTKLCQDRDLKNVPVIAIGDSQLLDELKPRILKYGFADALTKPIDPRALEDSLKKIFKGHTHH
jgi:CheY-like chemotaxis protein